MGMPSSVWFDRKQISPLCDEDLTSIDEMCANLDVLVEQEIKNGIPKERIMIGRNVESLLSIGFYYSNNTSQRDQFHRNHVSIPKKIALFWITMYRAQYAHNYLSRLLTNDFPL
jgi:hypothetical protein